MREDGADAGAPAPSGRDGLNPAQRAAVEHPGPVAVLAGPGTGKTRVIIHRIAHLIRERGMDPSRIVAVTFTIKAAEQLRRRLASAVGPVDAEAVVAATYHGFSMRLIQRFADWMGLPSQTRIMDAAQWRRLLREGIEGLGLFEGRRGEGADALLVEASRAIAAMKNAGLRPVDALGLARRWMELVAQGRDAGGQPLSDADARVAQRVRAEFHADAARLYDWSFAMCGRRGWLQYDDMILRPLALLRENEAARSIVRTDHRAWVVDEFQDSNPAQIELLRLLSGPTPNDPAPEVCVVGDDDQSIYAFRGADDRSFARFREIWPSAAVLPLTDNYRSAPVIVSASNAIISRAHERFDPTKATRPGPGKEHAPGAGVEVVSTASEPEHAGLIATMLLIERARAIQEGRPFAWRGRAVIVRTHGEADRIASALALEGIPFTRTRPLSMLDDEGVLDALAWLEWLVRPGSTWAARRVLVRPPAGLDPAMVADWETRHRAGRDRGEGPSASYAAYLEAHGVDESGRRPAGLAWALEVHARLKEGIGSARGDVMVERIIREAGVVHADLLPERDRAARVSAVLALLRLAREKQDRLAPPGDAAAFLEYFEELRAANDLAKSQDGLDESEREDADGGPDGRDAVSVLTAHASKGLEFDTVYVPRVNSPHGFPKSGSRDDDAGPPAELLAGAGGDGRSATQRAQDEERRIFYVACTRAERRLVLLTRGLKAKGKSAGKSAATNFARELEQDRPTEVISRTSGEVWAQAVELGAVAPGGPAGDADLGAPTRARAELSDLLDRLESAARRDASRALESISHAPEEPAVAEGLAILRRSGGILAMAAGARRHQEAPAWARQSDPATWERVARALQRAREDREEAARGAGRPSGGRLPASIVHPVPGPLRLSYTSVQKYLDCPACWYLYRVRGLPEAGTPEATLGSVAHVALQRFYAQWKDADAEGAPLPTTQALLEIGGSAYRDALGSTRAEDPLVLSQLFAQLRACHERLHDPEADVLELERSVHFTLEHRGTHRVEAKIDRVDRVEGPDGGVRWRIIDYKTGRPSQRLLEPKKDDLQMGIYALAIDAAHGGGSPVAGTAEYWCLATGQRGTIPLERIDRDGIREVLREVVDGMLDGRFEAAHQCAGPCGLFVRGLDPGEQSDS